MYNRGGGGSREIGWIVKLNKICNMGTIEVAFIVEKDDSEDKDKDHDSAISIGFHYLDRWNHYSVAIENETNNRCELKERKKGSEHVLKSNRDKGNGMKCGY